MPEKSPDAIFATDFAALARELAMDIFPLSQVLELHQLSDEEWMRIQSNTNFKAMLDQMVVDWNSASNTKQRVKIKAATGLESVLETYIQEIADVSIPLAQRVEAGKFLARLGELDGSLIEGGGADRFSITLNIGNSSTTVDATPAKVIEHEAIS